LPTASISPATSTPDGDVRLAHQLADDREGSPAVHVVPVERVHGGGANSDEHAIVGDGRPLDLAKVQHVGGAGPLLHEGLHRRSGLLCRHMRLPRSFSFAP